MTPRCSTICAPPVWISVPRPAEAEANLPKTKRLESLISWHPRLSSPPYQPSVKRRTQEKPTSSRVCGRQQEENRRLRQRWRLAGQGQDCKTIELEGVWTFIQMGINKLINILEGKLEPQFSSEDSWFSTGICPPVSLQSCLGWPRLDLVYGYTNSTTTPSCSAQTCQEAKGEATLRFYPLGNPLLFTFFLFDYQSWKPPLLLCSMYEDDLYAMIYVSVSFFARPKDIEVSHLEAALSGNDLNDSLPTNQHGCHAWHDWMSDGHCVRSGRSIPDLKSTIIIF